MMRKTILALLMTMSMGWAMAQNGASQKPLKIGDKISFMQLKGVDDKIFDLAKSPSSVKGYIIIFMSNTCDHCILYRQRIKDLNKKYKAKGFPLIAISPLAGQPEKWPLDAMPAMKVTAKKEKFDFPYLTDDKDLLYTYIFDIFSTPTAAVIKREGKSNQYSLIYRGIIDNSERDARLATQHYVSDAVDSILKK